MKTIVIYRDLVFDKKSHSDAIPVRALFVILAAKLFGHPKSLEQMSTECKRLVENQ